MTYVSNAARLVHIVQLVSQWIGNSASSSYDLLTEMLSVKCRNVKQLGTVEKYENGKTENPEKFEKCSSRAKRPKVIKNPTKTAYADKPVRRDIR